RLDDLAAVRVIRESVAGRVTDETNAGDERRDAGDWPEGEIEDQAPVAAAVAREAERPEARGDDEADGHEHRARGDVAPRRIRLEPHLRREMRHQERELDVTAAGGVHGGGAGAELERARGRAMLASDG